jgi:hypothetical protein
MASNNQWALGWFFNIYYHDSQKFEESIKWTFYKAAAYFIKTAGLENVKSQSGNFHKVHYARSRYRKASYWGHLHLRVISKGWSTMLGFLPKQNPFP